jgi:predicted transcriptional regulator
VTIPVKDLQIEESLWATFTSLLDGPMTARGIAVRQDRPLALVVSDLNRLFAKGLIVESGAEHMGGWKERLYKLPENALKVYDENALQFCLHQVSRGVRQANLLNLPYAAELAAVRIAQPAAQAILQKLRGLREEAERANTADGDEKLTIFVAGWLEP